jgi:hypothetical protein
LPAAQRGRRFVDALTGQTVEPALRRTSTQLPVEQLFMSFPVALLLAAEG